LHGAAITVDGKLDDAAWAQAVWISDFVQKRPREGAPPSDSMRIAILYDDAAVYVGARMFSRDPSKIQAPLSRRDNTFQAERMWVSFDSYRSEEHTSELQSRFDLVCRLLLEKKKICKFLAVALFTAPQR